MDLGVWREVGRVIERRSGSVRIFKWGEGERRWGREVGFKSRGMSAR